MAAKLMNGLYGPVSGKIGNLVFCKRNGNTYVRSAPKPKKNQLLTQKQQDARSKFQMMQILTSKVLPFIRIGFKNLQANHSPSNAAMSYNLREAFALEPQHNSIVLLWQNISFSRGIPLALQNVELNLLEDMLTVRWEIDANIVEQLDLYTFKCTLLIIPENFQEENIQGCINENNLSIGHQSMQVLLSADIKYHCYMAFFSSDGSGRVTDSKWLGMIGGE